MVMPVYEKLAEEYQGRFKFCMINVDENQRAATKYQNMSIPMQKYFVDGQEADEILGAVPAQVIRSRVEEIMVTFPSDERGKLDVLLNSWVEHSKLDGSKFRRWMEKAKSAKDDPIYSSISQAAQEMEKANERLSQLSIELQGRG